MIRSGTVLVAVLGLLLAACGGGGGGTTEKRVRLETTATEFQFAPKSWEIPAGELVKIVIQNRGTVEHDFAIPELKIAVKAAAGKNTEKDFAPIKAGIYNVECTVAGHKESGMVGTLVVK